MLNTVTPAQHRRFSQIKLRPRSDSVRTLYPISHHDVSATHKITEEKPHKLSSNKRKLELCQGNLQLKHFLFEIKSSRSNEQVCQPNLSGNSCKSLVQRVNVCGKKFQKEEEAELSGLWVSGFNIPVCTY